MVNLFGFYGMVKTNIWMDICYYRWTRSYRHIRISLKKTKQSHLSVLHSHKVLMEECPCWRYRQLNSML